MTGFNAQQYAKFLSGLAALNLAPPADIQEVLCDPQTAQRIVGSSQRVSTADGLHYTKDPRQRWPPVTVICPVASRTFCLHGMCNCMQRRSYGVSCADEGGRCAVCRMTLV